MTTFLDIVLFIGVVWMLWTGITILGGLLLVGVALLAAGVSKLVARVRAWRAT